MPRPSRTAAAARRLTLRDLNRATLARQSLLARAPGNVDAMVQHLVGLQAQWPAPPFVGLWSRMAKFGRHDLVSAVASKRLVRATLMRGTLHLTTADDFVAFRAMFQPVLSRALASIPAERRKGFDLDAFAKEARRVLGDRALTFESIREALAPKFPRVDVRAMGYAVRMHVPLVQVPGDGAWGFPQEPSFALADRWLGRDLFATSDEASFVRRYLAAFGPASARDAETWSGLRKLGDTFEALRAELVAFTDDEGRELFDLPNAPRPGSDAAAPARFLPEFDSLTLAHTDRTRVIPKAFHKKVFLSALRVRATVLVDGFVKGGWKLERAKTRATLRIEPFVSLTKSERAALEEEGDRLARFMAEDATAWEVRFEKM